MLARQQAIAALVHRLNGGLHNAALALELASARDDPSLSSILKSGVHGVEQASRAAAMVDALVRPAPAPPTLGPYLVDAADLLRAHAAKCGVDLRVPSDGELRATTPHAAAECLVQGLSALAEAQSRAHANASLVMRASTHDGAPGLAIELRFIAS